MIQPHIKSQFDKILGTFLSNGISPTTLKIYIMNSIYIKLKYYPVFKNIIEKQDYNEIISQELIKNISDYDLFRKISIMLDSTEIKKEGIFELYEYMLFLCSDNAKKFTGEYYTPQEVSSFVSNIAFLYIPLAKNIYDPTCGNASLLINAKKDRDLEVYGQDINKNSVLVANYIKELLNLEGRFESGDTLKDDKIEKQFDIIASNPPYSIQWDADALKDDYRFKDKPLAPKSKADFAFILHCLAKLQQNGVLICICFPGIMYRGGSEQKIREYLIKNNLVESIIQLPSNIFTYTSISTTILIIRKNKTNNNVFFMDCSNDFTKSKINIFQYEKPFDTLSKRLEIDNYSKIVANSEIEKNDYNLSVSSYIIQKDNREVIDINELNKNIIELRERNYQAFKELDEWLATIF